MSEYLRASAFSKLRENEGCAEEDKGRNIKARRVKERRDLQKW